MPLTLEQVEQITVSRARTFMALCGMAVSGTPNPDLADPIASALLALGYPVADVTAPTTDDLAAVPDGRSALFLGVVHLNALDACVGAWARCDQRISLGEQKFSQVADQMLAVYDRLAARLREEYGYGRRRTRPARVAPIEAGNVWPPPPPPPSSPPPWPPGSRTPPRGPRGFNL